MQSPKAQIKIASRRLPTGNKLYRMYITMDGREVFSGLEKTKRVIASKNAIEFEGLIKDPKNVDRVWIGNDWYFSVFKNKYPIGNSVKSGSIDSLEELIDLMTSCEYEVNIDTDE